MPKPKKQDFSFAQARLDQEDRNLFAKLVTKMKVSMSDVIRIAIREKAEREGVRA